MKSCEEFKNKIAEYYYDELPVAERSELEAHLKNCPVCAKELRSTAAMLKKVSEVKRPALAGSLYPSINMKLEQRRGVFGKFWNVPFAATVALLVVLAVFSNNQNLSLAKSAELEETYLLSNVIELDSKDMDSLNGLDLEILADELFAEDNFMTFGS